MKYKNRLKIKKSISEQNLLFFLIVIFCISLQWFEQSNNVRYDRDLIISGDWYRLVSANFVHINILHLLMNLIGLVIISFAFSSYLKTIEWLSLIIFSSFFVSACLFLFNSDVEIYVGLSGVLHALFVVGVIIEVRRFTTYGWLLAIIIILKLMWEQIYGTFSKTEILIDGYIVADSHLYGAISGMFFIILIMLNKHVFQMRRPVLPK